MTRIRSVFIRLNRCGKLTKRQVVLELSAFSFVLYTALIALAQSDTGPGPQIPYWSQWTDQSGQTHTTRCMLSGLESQPFAAAPQFVRRLPGPVENIVFTQLPVGWVGDWHVNPKRQWVISLSGEYYMETSDGSSATIKAGDVFFGGDQGAKASTTDPKKVGHYSRVVGNEPSNHVILQLNDKRSGNKIGVACPY